MHKLMGKSQDQLQLTMPLLKSETNFRNWDEALLRILGTKSLRHYIEFEVQTPMRYVTVGSIERLQTDNQDRLLIEKLRPLNTSRTNRLPLSLKETVLSGSSVVTITSGRTSIIAEASIDRYDYHC